MKVLIIGGHLTPALGVINQLPKGTKIMYVGRKYPLEGDKAFSLEYKIITEKGITFIPFHPARLQRTITKHFFPLLFKLPSGFLEALKIVKTSKPDVIVGFGGYVSLPLCIAGYFLHIPVVIHEQTLEIGLANKLLSKFATKICVSWASSLRFFPKNKTVITGNPAVSSLIENLSKTSLTKIDPKKLVIVGGSQGSHAINNLVEKVLPQLLEHYSIFHQTGDAKEFGDFDRLTTKKLMLNKNLQKKYTLTKFIKPEEIVEIFTSADLVISRAGMNTMLTLLILNKPTLFIPIPTSSNQEQLKNALFFKNHGLGEVLLQKTATPQEFLKIIYAMMNNIHQYTNKEDRDKLKLHAKAAENIVNIIILCANKSDKKES